MISASAKKLHLTVGKEVSLSFSGDGLYLNKIKLSINKLSEIINNGLVDGKSIFEIDEIYLITKSNFRTSVKINNGKLLLGDTEEIPFSVDKGKTKRHKKGKSIFTSGDFVFYVEPTQKLTKQQFHILNRKNSKSYNTEPLV